MKTVLARAPRPRRRGAAATPAVGAADARTRDRVAQLLLENGPSTAAELGAQLGLSAAAVRRHLDAMLAQAVITERTARPGGRRGRGRPARVFTLTDAGHAAGPMAYDELASTALRFLAEHGGPAAVRDFAAERAAELAARLSERLGVQAPAGVGVDPVSTAAALAAAMTAEGYASTAHEVATGAQLCQHHCPVQAVAEQFPQLCEAETAMLSRLVGTHVQRLATIAHGDGVCTTHLPARRSATEAAGDSIATTPTGR